MVAAAAERAIEDSDRWWGERVQLPVLPSAVGDDVSGARMQVLPSVCDDVSERVPLIRRRDFAGRPEAAAAAGEFRLLQRAKAAEEEESSGTCTCSRSSPIIMAELVEAGDTGATGELPLLESSRRRRRPVLEVLVLAGVVERTGERLQAWGAQS